MADLNELQSAGTTKVIGSNSSGVETNPISGSVNGDLGTADGLTEGGVYGSLTLTTANTAYEAKVGGSKLAYRKSLIITALDNNIYWGYNSSVTTSNGIPLYKNQQIIFSIDPTSSFEVWLVAANNNKVARIAEAP